MKRLQQPNSIKLTATSHMWGNVAFLPHIWRARGRHYSIGSLLEQEFYSGLNLKSFDRWSLGMSY